MTSRGCLYVDEDTGRYKNLRLPPNWTVHREPAWLSLQGSMTWAFENYPDASQYGWLADDNRPRTNRWDTTLEAAAGRWNLAYARDLWMSENDIDVARLRTGNDLSAGLCWGGDLVRTVGWWALPDVVQAGIDTAWTELTRPLGLYRYVEDVVVEHLNWRTGKRPKDAVDEWARAGDEYIERDIAARNEWAWSHRYRDTLTLIAESMRYDVLTAPLVHALAQSAADEQLRANGGVKQTVITRLNELERAAVEYHRHHPHPQPTQMDP